ncbi:LuxR family transcriptional regulator [Halomonas cupida]|uniref:DNA-binding transcriptional regulator, CsgD family n=1 Tax=Halomonas cupida TaxID=44933 RepID=A0A1M7J4J3_9GAMM|nr:helix-turn-helix transcriptional regulator [Halomonas cupida]GEN24308.1 LuxR family transcriptional regulator [Halomonas cupida]SHM47753.1 DNA-binding transcriptional regulator, CsgD family [Halomonas cupida]
MTNSADKLADLIYAAMLGESPWQHFLDQLAHQVPNGKTVLVMHDEAVARGHIPLASGVDPGILRLYGAYYASVNLFIAPAATRPNGVGFVDEALVPLRQLRKTEFYNDFLAPHEMPSRVSLTIEHEQNEVFILALLSDAINQDDKQQVAHMLSSLAPHLQRAARFYRQSTAPCLDGQIFDAMDIAVAIVGEPSRLKRASPYAERLLSTGYHLSLNACGRLVMGNAEAQRRLQGMLSRWYCGPKVVTLQLPDARITLIRLVDNDISFYFEGPTVAVLIEESDGSLHRLDLPRIGALFQLSPAELRALADAIDGKSTQQIAEESARSVETIRSQLKSLYRKTDCHSREDLLKRILALR